MDNKNSDKSYKSRSMKNMMGGGAAVLLAFLVLIAFLPVNLIVDMFNIKWDMTPNKLYTLTDMSLRVIDDLETTVNIYVLFDRDAIRAELKPLDVALEQYDSYDKINVISADPYTEEGTAVLNKLQLDEGFTLQWGDFLVMSGSVAKVVPLKEMFEFNYGYDSDGNEISELKSFIGENLLTGTIKYVDHYASINRQPVIYFLSGHNEKNNYNSFIEEAISNGYKVDELNLIKDNAVPDDAKVIIIAAPENDITSDERRLLEEYLDNGGCISFLMSPNEGEFSYTNIEEIMRQFAIGMRYDMAEVDEASGIDKEENGQKDKNIFIAEYSAVSDSAPDADITAALIAAENIYPVASYTRTFYQIMTDNFSQLQCTPSSQTGEYAVSIPFGGTNPDADSISGPLYLSLCSLNKSRNNSKIFVIGDADFIDDDNISDEISLGNYYLFAASVSWMVESDINMNIPAKESMKDYMIINSKKESDNIILLLSVIPAVIAIAGIIVWIRRRGA